MHYDINKATCVTTKVLHIVEGLLAFYIDQYFKIHGAVKDGSEISHFIGWRYNIQISDVVLDGALFFRSCFGDHKRFYIIPITFQIFFCKPLLDITGEFSMQVIQTVC